MKFDVKKDGVEFRHKEKTYFLNEDELRAFQIAIDWIPKHGIHEGYYWIVSTSSDPLYKEMSGLVFCDLQDAIKVKVKQPKKKSIAG